MAEEELGRIFVAGARRAVAEDLVEVKGTADEPIVLKHAKLVFEKPGGRVDKNGNPRSCGYGFVEFSAHSHAAGALRALAHNPAALAAEGRPKAKRGLFVEFALDDTRKLELQKKRRERNRVRGKAPQPATDDIPAAKEAKARPQKGGKALGKGAASPPRPATEARAAHPAHEPRPSRSPVGSPRPTATTGAPKQARVRRDDDGGAAPLRGRKLKRARDVDDDAAFHSLVARHRQKLQSAAGLRAWVA